MANDTRNAELNLKIAGQANLTNATPKKELAIVSPCSTCQNFTQSASTSQDPHRSMCPRRIWIQQQQQNPDNPELVDRVLYFSGTDDPNMIINPVVDKDTGNYVVWVAAVEDNPGIVDEQTNNPIPHTNILDPEFDTTYIKCRLYPYVPEQRHDVLRSLGAFQEGDKIMAEEHRIPALNPTVQLTNAQTLFTETPVAGTVSKTSFAYSFDTRNPDDHALVAG